MVEVPERLRCNTGEQGEVYNTIDRFFELVILEDGGRRFDYRTAVEGHFIDSEQGPLSDNYSHMLYRQGHLVAVVNETRDDMNWIEFTFAHFPLDE